VILVFLRHGVAEDKGPPDDDAKRRLTDDGRKEVRRVAKGLATMETEFAACLTSPLVRARETAEEACDVLLIRELRLEESLRPDGRWDGLRGALQGFPNDSAVLLVGHEPSMSALIAGAIGVPEARIEMKKAGVARVDLDSPSSPGELKFLLRPKQAAALSG